MKKLLPIFMLALACVFQMSVFAATGNVKIEVPEEAGEITVSYAKIAEWEDTSQEEFQGTPVEDLEYENEEKFAVGETIKLMDLEDGIYQIQIQGKVEYEFSPVVVSVPLWNEETEQMEYEILMEPKYILHIPEPEPEITPEPEVPKESSPKTGDYKKVAIYGFFGIFSLLIVIMSCHNRLKCARMSE